MNLLYKLLCLTVATLSFLTAETARSQSISGSVTDENNEPVSYATVVLKGTMYGSNTDLDGNYRIENIPAGEYVIQVSYVGYRNYEQPVSISSGTITVNIILELDYSNLDEVVVVGYGTQQTRDLTGSITSLGSRDFLSGNITTPEKLISGKVAGIQITSNGGAPGSGSRIRIRGGSSLNASNDPLIVIDGVPVDNNGISGSANALNLINPNDIENITILKDASASAIYGSRAANGVILITTKKGFTTGDNKLGVEFSTNNSVSQITSTPDVFTGDALRELVNSTGSAEQIALLGTENTDWLDVITRTAISSDNNLTLGGGIDDLPYRVSLNYLNEQGILLTSSLKRYGAALNAAPQFFNDQLKVDLNAKFAYTNNFFAEQGAIGAAVSFDPTQPVYADNIYGGYFQWLDPNTGKPNVLAPKNPLGLLEQKEDISNVYRFLGNANIQYTLPFLTDLSANLNLGADVSRSNGEVLIPAEAASAYADTLSGRHTQYEQNKDNKLLEFFLNYKKGVESIKSNFDVTAGYSYQDWIRSNPSFPTLSADGGVITPAGIPFKTQNTLISFYGRLNYSLLSRYLFTFTLRNDGSSRFSPDTRWGLFPSAAFAWRISDESFLSNSEVIYNLKLRLGYGITGQQDVFNDYPYVANYDEGELTAQYQFGDVFYTVLRPDGYDANIKWEETETLNAGIDFGFLGGRIFGALDVYRKKTKDLLSVIPIPAGTNFTNQILTNVGSLENSGVEIALSAVPVDNKNWYWEIGANATVNKNEITNLTKVEDPDDEGILVGGISGGVGNTIQIHTVGFPTYTFYSYQQQYDESGNPIEGEFVDVNGDGIINNFDLVRSENPEPKLYAGMYTLLGYGNWNLSLQMRGNFGNYMYNNVNSQLGNYTNIDGSKNYLNNIIESYNQSLFVEPQYLSDYYIEDASFIKLDNVSLGYDFTSLIGSNFGLNAALIVQNVFTITDYSGLDPEIAGGIDNNIYPRPRIYSLRLNFSL